MLAQFDLSDNQNAEAKIKMIHFLIEKHCKTFFFHLLGWELAERKWAYTYRDF